MPNLHADFHCLMPRSYSLFSSNTSHPFSSATFFLHLQLVLIFPHLSLMLETCHYYSHTQTWQTCWLSSLLSSNFSHLLYIQTFPASGSQSPLQHPLQDLTHLFLDCPASEPLRRAIFGTTSSIFDLWSRPWGVDRLLSLHGVPPHPHPPEEVG